MLAVFSSAQHTSDMKNNSELTKLVGNSIRPDDISSILGRILPSGGVIHGYSSAGGTRILMVTESIRYSDSAPLLGFGMDGNAERALVRALATYVKREQQGIAYIKEDQFPESTRGQIATGRHPSRFDNIVWNDDFKMYQDGDEIVTASSHGGGEHAWSFQPLEVRDSTPLGAVVKLTDEYKFFSSLQSVTDRIKALPSISLD